MTEHSFIKLVVRGRRSVGITLGVALLSVGLLAGCTPASTSTSSATGKAAGASASPTPTPVAFGSPGNATCDDLASLASVQAALGSTKVVQVPYSAIEQGGPPQLLDITVPMAGGMDCLWQDPGVGHELIVRILPRATADLAAQVKSLNQYNDATDGSKPTGVPQYGDQSWTYCLGLQASLDGTCFFTIRVGSYWITIQEDPSPDQKPYPQPASVSALLSGIVTEAKTFPEPEPLWTPPVESFAVPTTCDDAIPTATVQKQMGDTTLKLDTTDGDNTDIGIVAGTADKFLNCSWDGASQDDSFTFTLLPGSAAVWSAANGPDGAAAAGLTQIAGIGDSAWQECALSGGDDECNAYVLLGHTWFDLDLVHPVPYTAGTFDTLLKDVVSSLG